MMDRQISATESSAWLLWAVAGVVVSVDLFVSTSDDLGHCGLVAAAAAATLHVRSWFCRFERRTIATIQAMGTVDRIR